MINQDADAGNPAPNVLQVLPRLDASGAARGAVDIARGAIAQGGTAVIASGDGAFLPEFLQAGGQHIDIDFDARLPWWRWTASKRIADKARAAGIDLIHAYGPEAARLARRAAAKAGVPFVASPIGSEGVPPDQWVSADMGEARAIIAPSPFVASLVPPDMAARLIMAQVPRGVDMVRFNPAAVSAERLINQARDWRADDVSTVILMPARLTPGKGHDVLIDALALMNDTEVICLLATEESSNDTYRAELEAKIDAANLAGRVRFVGHAPDMPVAYMMADVVVAPSRTPEAFNGIAVEAQAMGRPIVATQIGSTPDLVLNGETGWLVPPANPQALAGALDTALKLNDHGRSIMALKGRMFIERTFSLDIARARMLDIYGSVLSGA